MGRNFAVELEGRSYRCKFCGTHLALPVDLVSRSFHCRRGKAYLFNNVVNITIGTLEERMMLSGLHTVADTFCCCCGQIVGWKYVSRSLCLSVSCSFFECRRCSQLNEDLAVHKALHLHMKKVVNGNFKLKLFIIPIQEAAHEKGQKYKEGKYVLERGRIVDEMDLSTGVFIDSRTGMSDAEDA